MVRHYHFRFIISTGTIARGPFTEHCDVLSRPRFPVSAMDSIEVEKNKLM
jgi:hypothetical protein